MELIRIFMGILLLICLILCIDFKKIDDLMAKHHPDFQNRESLTLLGLRVENFRGRVRVSEVLEYTPARESGIEAGDRILEVEGTKINNTDNFIDCVENAHDKEKIKLLVYRVDSCSKFPVEVALLGGFRQCK